MCLKYILSQTAFCSVLLRIYGWFIFDRNNVKWLKADPGQRLDKETAEGIGQFSMLQTLCLPPLCFANPCVKLLTRENIFLLGEGSLISNHCCLIRREKWFVYVITADCRGLCLESVCHCLHCLSAISVPELHIQANWHLRQIQAFTSQFQIHQMVPYN